MKPSASGVPTPGWVSFQSATQDGIEVRHGLTGGEIVVAVPTRILKEAQKIAPVASQPHSFFPQQRRQNGRDIRATTTHLVD